MFLIELSKHVSLIEILKEAPAIVCTSLAIIFLITSLLIALLSLLPRIKSQFKMIGVFLIVGISLLANSPAIYMLAIFIIATIFTDLEFLEKIAALFLRSDKYWDYLIKKATPAEIEEKKRQEIKRINNGNNAEYEIKAAIEPIGISESMQIEARVMELLGSSQGLFPMHQMNTGVSIKNGRQHYVLDAIGQGPDAEYIIEIKRFSSQKAFEDGIFHIGKYINAYKQIISKKNQETQVRGLLIIPDSFEVSDFIGEDVGILKYDSSDNTFKNLDKIMKWVYPS